MFAAIGIVKGEPFNPDATTRSILDKAAKTAYKMSRVIGFEKNVSGRSFLIYPDRHWVNPVADGTPSNPGGAMDLAWHRTDGTPLSGGGNYRLNLPANIPAANFWSLTLYEAENASGLANRRPFPSLGSRDKPAQNTDGSTDLYLGPKPPEGKGANWLATVPGKGYFAILRLYSPTEAAIDKSWKPGDIEKTN